MLILVLTLSLSVYETIKEMLRKVTYKELFLFRIKFFTFTENSIPFYFILSYIILYHFILFNFLLFSLALICLILFYFILFHNFFLRYFVLFLFFFLPGVTLTDMGKKTVGNDLDNASIRFENLV